MGEWISTKERLPDSDGAYLVYGGFAWNVCIKCYNSEYGCWDDEEGDDYECPIDGIDYWMPLPDSPK